jgi:hypothetical protein
MRKVLDNKGETTFRRAKEGKSTKNHKTGTEQLKNTANTKATK